MAYDLPRTLTLPSGRRVTVRDGTPRPRERVLFADVFALGVALDEGGVAVPLEDLVLADFHVVRAVLTKAGRLDEAAETIACQNCDAELTLKPCARLETGPWEDGEANDPELDRTGPFGEVVDGVVLAQRTVREAFPFFRALARKRLKFTPEVVAAMGISALDGSAEPGAVARLLETCSEERFAAIVDVWLDAHYPLRLGADVTCGACQARNTIDAPAERELDREAPAHGGALPSLDAFVERAHAIAAPLLEAHPGVELVVEDGTPAVDDGGEPLLGAYLPPPPEDAPVPMRPPTVTIYWRTFVACARDDARFDWTSELEETIEHELQHHAYWLRGDDPMDEEERAEILREAVRVVGRSESDRRALASFGAGMADFVRRGWPLILIAALVLAISFGESRCSE